MPPSMVVWGTWGGNGPPKMCSMGDEMLVVVIMVVVAVVLVVGQWDAAGVGVVVVGGVDERAGMGVVVVVGGAVIPAGDPTG